jgi:hypothetical protein
MFHVRAWLSELGGGVGGGLAGGTGGGGPMGGGACIWFSDMGSLLQNCRLNTTVSFPWQAFLSVKIPLRPCAFAWKFPS